MLFFFSTFRVCIYRSSLAALSRDSEQAVEECFEGVGNGVGPDICYFVKISFVRAKVTPTLSDPRHHLDASSISGNEDVGM